MNTINSYQLIFVFEGNAGCFAGSSGQACHGKGMPFVKEYFPEAVIPDINGELQE